MNIWKCVNIFTCLTIDEGGDVLAYEISRRRRSVIRGRGSGMLCTRGQLFEVLHAFRECLEERIKLSRPTIDKEQPSFSVSRSFILMFSWEFTVVCMSNDSNGAVQIGPLKMRTE